MQTYPHSDMKERTAGSQYNSQVRAARRRRVADLTNLSLDGPLWLGEFGRTSSALAKMRVLGRGIAVVRRVDSKFPGMLLDARMQRWMETAGQDSRGTWGGKRAVASGSSNGRCRGRTAGEVGVEVEAEAETEADGRGRLEDRASEDE